MTGPGGRRAGCALATLALAVAAFALALALPSAPACAQGATGSAPPAVAPAPAPATLGPAAHRKASVFDEPRWVMMRSLVIPGWGQLHNRSWLKAVAVAGAEGVVGWRIVQDLQELDRLSAEIDAARADSAAAEEVIAITAYNDRQSKLVAREWLLAAVVLYAMVDAYVDAHFRNFDIEFRGDPALPGGVPDRKSMIGPLETRLAIRWKF